MDKAKDIISGLGESKVIVEVFKAAGHSKVGDSVLLTSIAHNCCSYILSRLSTTFQCCLIPSYDSPLYCRPWMLLWSYSSHKPLTQLLCCSVWTMTTIKSSVSVLFLLWVHTYCCCTVHVCKLRYIIVSVCNWTHFLAFHTRLIKPGKVWQL